METAEPQRQPATTRARSAEPVRTVFYRRPPPQPEQETDPTVLSEPVMERVPVRSGEFNSAPWVGSTGDLEIMGEFISTLRENREIGGAPTAHPRDEIFLGYEGGARPEVDQRLLLIRVGKRLAGGRVLEPTAVVRVTRLEDEVMFGLIETQYGAVYPGQVAARMPTPPAFEVEDAEPVAAEAGYDLEGRVIEFRGDPPLPSMKDIGFVNRGARDGVQVGDVFTAYLPPRAARERGVGDLLSNIERLPPEQVARLRVVRVGENVATVKVEAVMLPRLEDGIGVRRTHVIP